MSPPRILDEWEPMTSEEEKTIIEFRFRFLHSTGQSNDNRGQQRRRMSSIPGWEGSHSHIYEMYPGPLVRKVVQGLIIIGENIKHEPAFLVQS